MEETYKLENMRILIPELNDGNKTFDETQPYAEVNIELSMRVGDYLGGHIITGHVSGTAPVLDINIKEDSSRDVWFDLSEFPINLQKLVVHKGSICLDAISLIVAELRWGNTVVHCRVSLIPYTIHNTIMRNCKIGHRFNVEFDHRNKQDEISSRNEQDEYYMKIAIALGEEGRLTAPPNPWVVCVIVADHNIIGRGFHRKAGEPHAEINALNDAIKQGNENLIPGSMLYVTLEPCHHTGRTSPCDIALLKNKIARVVVAIEDPDERVRGQGIKLLSDEGIEVTVGICREDVLRLFKPYIHHRNTGLPYVVSKIALSMDGAIACNDRTSQWITKETAASQVIIVGSQTAIIDKPKLTVRGVSGLEVKPLRVVVDSIGKVTDGPLLDVTLGQTLIFCGPNIPRNVLNIWEAANVEVKSLPLDKQGYVPLTLILEELGRRGILQLLIERGAKLSSQFLKQELVNQLVIYQGACIIGNSGYPWFQEALSNTMTDIKFWKLTGLKQLDNDVCMIYNKI